MSTSKCFSFALTLMAGAALAAPAALLFDGRLAEGQASLPGPSLADLPAVQAEVERRLAHPYLQGLAPGAKVQQGSSDFLVRGGLAGSFTRTGARQKGFLYRLGLTSGLVVLEQGSVVAHYNGVASDYAHYIFARGVDLNQDGLTDLVLNHNTEDSEAVDSHVFLMTPQGPLFQGATPVFRSNVQAGEEKPEQVRADAYVLNAFPGRVPQFRRDHYHRQAAGGWVLKSRSSKVQLEHRQPCGFEPRLLRLTPEGSPRQADIQVALNKLSSYSDVASTINYARPANAGQAMVAGDPGLRLMELLDTRAAIYAHENATGQQVDHKNAGKFGLSLVGLTSAEQIRQAYIRHTNDSLGGLSPYASR